MAEANDAIEELLTCSLCLDLFKEPKTLRCLHSYCVECLRKLTQNKEDKPITCPLCRDETVIPDEGIEDIPTNFFIKNMLDVVELKSKIENPQCSNCEEGLPAQCRCMDCEEFFCETCLAAHQRLKANVEHKILDLKKLLLPNSSKEFHPAMKCMKHQEVCKFYCQTCDVLVCRDCTVLDHTQPKHAVADLKDISDRYRDHFYEQMERAEKYIGKVENVQSITEQNKEELKKSVNKITSQLNARKDSLIEQVSETLEGQVSKMLAGIEEFVSVKMQQDEKEVKSLGSDLKRMRNYVLFMRHLLASGNDDEMMNMYEHLVCCLDDNTGRNPFWFEMNCHVNPVELSNEGNDEEMQRLTEEIKACLGKLSIPNTNATRYKITEEKEMPYDIGKDIKVPINQVGSSVAQPSINHPDLGSFHAKVLTPQQTIISGKLQQDEDGSISVHFTSFIEGRHRLAVCLGDSEISGSPMSINVKGKLDYLPETNILQELPLQHWNGIHQTFSAAVSVNGNIYVLIDGQVYVFDAEFNLLLSFGELGHDPGQMEAPMDIAIDRDERVIVCDIGKHKLLVFDKSGIFSQEISEHGGDPGQLNCPLGVATDRCCNIAVCDTGNQRVQVFNPDGTLKLNFGGEAESSVMHPIATVFNSHGHIIVSESSLWSQNRLHSSQARTFEAKDAVECVKIFDRMGKLMKKFGAPGDGLGQFWAPTYVNVDSQDHIWVAEFSFGRIQVFDPEGNVVQSYSSGEEEKGTGWLCVTASGANGAILYYRLYFDNV